jgi:hypothetical protein
MKWKWVAGSIKRRQPRRCCVTRACLVVTIVRSIRLEQWYPPMLFFQINPTFQRFDCKVFLTDAVRYTNGAPERVMIDNT